MHNLKPKSSYKLVGILVAVPAELNEGEIADGMSEMLNAACAAPDGIVADWCYQRPKTRQGVTKAWPVKKTGKVVEEGELFLCVK